MLHDATEIKVDAGRQPVSRLDHSTFISVSQSLPIRRSRIGLIALWAYVRAPGGINYLLVTLNPGEQWTYEPPAGHTISWVAVGRGALHAGEGVSNGELAIFDNSEAPLTLEGGVRCTFGLNAMRWSSSDRLTGARLSRTCCTSDPPEFIIDMQACRPPQ